MPDQALLQLHEQAEISALWINNNETLGVGPEASKNSDWHYTAFQSIVSAEVTRQRFHAVMRETRTPSSAITVCVSIFIRFQWKIMFRLFHTEQARINLIVFEWTSTRFFIPERPTWICPPLTNDHELMANVYHRNNAENNNMQM